jgi:hypothetical protein
MRRWPATNDLPRRLVWVIVGLPLSLYIGSALAVQGDFPWQIGAGLLYLAIVAWAFAR